MEPASPDLIARIRKHGREIVIACEGSDEERLLKHFGAEANVNAPNNTHMIVLPGIGKSTLLEEYLHGTQFKLGLVTEEYPAGLNVATAKVEYHVKDFMLRHHRILGLQKPDVAMLHKLRDREKQIIEGQGHELPNAYKRRVQLVERHHHPDRKPRGRKGYGQTR